MQRLRPVESAGPHKSEQQLPLLKQTVVMGRQVAPRARWPPVAKAARADPVNVFGAASCGR